MNWTRETILDHIRSGRAVDLDRYETERFLPILRRLMVEGIAFLQPRWGDNGEIVGNRVRWTGRDEADALGIPTSSGIARTADKLAQQFLLDGKSLDAVNTLGWSAYRIGELEEELDIQRVERASDAIRVQARV